MKRNLFILVASFLIPLFGMAQSTVTTGTPYKAVKALRKYSFKSGNELLTVKVHKRTIILQKINTSTLALISRKNYKKCLPNNSFVEEVVAFNDKYYVFYYVLNIFNRNEELFYREIDFKTGQFKGEANSLMKVPGGIVITIKDGDHYSSFEFSLSSDSTKMLIKYKKQHEYAYDRKNYDIIGTCVFDANLKQFWAKEVKMPYTEKKMNNLDYSVDSEGNVYMLTTVYDDNTTDVKKNGGKEANFHIELFRISPTSDKIEISPVKVDKDKFVGKVKFFERPNNTMLCVGLYNEDGDDETLNAANGIFLFAINKEGKLSDVVSYKIPVEILNQYVNKQKKEKNEKEETDIWNLNMRELVTNADGSILIIGEQYGIGTPSTTTTTFTTASSFTTVSTTTTSSVVHYYDDILLTKIDASGKLLWMKRLPKKQAGKFGKAGMSYKYMHVGNNNYFLFVDNAKNIDLPLDKVPTLQPDYKKSLGLLTAYKVSDANGEVSKLSILDTRNVNDMTIYQIRVTNIAPLKDGSFVFEAYKKKKEDILIKVKLKK